MRPNRSEQSSTPTAANSVTPLTEQALEYCGFLHTSIDGGKVVRGEPSKDSAGRVYTARERVERKATASYLASISLTVGISSSLERTGII